MDTTIIKSETFVCAMCGYNQNFDPFVDGVMAAHFPEFPGIPNGACPACYSGRNPDRTMRDCQLFRAVDLSQLTVQTVASDATLEATEVPDLDTNGQQIMEQTGEHYELQVNQSTGAVGSVLVPDYAPKMRLQTTEELAALTLQRNQSLDELDKVAVSTVTESTTTPIA